jgi:hypothetical protein
MQRHSCRLAFAAVSTAAITLVGVVAVLGSASLAAAAQTQTSRPAVPITATFTIEVGKSKHLSRKDLKISEDALITECKDHGGKGVECEIAAMGRAIKVTCPATPVSTTIKVVSDIGGNETTTYYTINCVAAKDGT